MGQPLTVSIPHQLGRAEARRRIDDGIGKFGQQFGDRAEFTKAWSGDVLNFTVNAMGQSITGLLDVVDDAVHIKVDLPGLLSLMSGKIKDKLRREGERLLEHKPAG
ncbi:polyhydroxyalkanoic acid system family protein [soil metagenome]